MSCKNYTPLTFSDKVVRLHDVRPAYSKLSTHGILDSGERALVLPGLVILPGQVPESYIKYLQKVGIGASKIIQVPADKAELLVEGLEDHQTAHIREVIKKGHRLQFFYPTDKDLKYVQDVLGYAYDACVWGSLPSLVAKTNDKVWQRRYHAEALVDVRFPEHYLVPIDDYALIQKRVGQLLKNHECAVIKHGRLAAGEGMFFVGGPDWRQQCTKAVDKLALHKIKTTEIIVEAGYPDHMPLSVQVEIDSDGPHYLATTLMNVRGTAHIGNMISSKSANLSQDIEIELKTRSLNFAQSLYKLGYLGYVGFDYINTKDGLFVIEINGRVTAATYLLAVALQAQNAGLDAWEARSETIHPGRHFTWESLRDTLEDCGLLFDGQRGVLPVCPSILPEKVMFYYIDTPTNIDVLVAKVRAAVL